MDLLPEELVIIILNFISDSKTYKNARITCKLWNNVLKDGKIFKNNELKQIIKFYDNYIYYFNPKLELLASVKFQNYGFYEYKQFKDKNYTITIKSKPLCLESTKSVGLYYEKKHYDSLTDKKTVTNFNIPQCILM